MVVMFPSEITTTSRQDGCRLRCLRLYLEGSFGWGHHFWIGEDENSTARQ